MYLRKVGVKSSFYQGFLVHNILVWQILCNTPAPSVLSLLLTLLLCQALMQLLLMSFPVLTAEQLLPALPSLCTVLTLPAYPSWPGWAPALSSLLWPSSLASVWHLWSISLCLKGNNLQQERLLSEHHLCLHLSAQHSWPG